MIWVTKVEERAHDLTQHISDFVYKKSDSDVWSASRQAGRPDMLILYFFPDSWTLLDHCLFGGEFQPAPPAHLKEH